MRCVDYLFEVVGEESEICGEQFLIEVDCDFEEDPLAVAWDIACEYFEGEKLEMTLGPISPMLAETLGYDTY